MDHNGTKWTITAQNGIKWIKMDRVGRIVWNCHWTWMTKVRAAQKDNLGRLNKELEELTQMSAPNDANPVLTLKFQ